MSGVMNWDILINAGTAAAAAGFMASLTLFIELKIPEAAACLRRKRRRRTAPGMLPEIAEESPAPAPERGHFVIRRTILAVWPEGPREWTESEPGEVFADGTEHRGVFADETENRGGFADEMENSSGGGDSPLFAHGRSSVCVSRTAGGSVREYCRYGEQAGKSGE